jgi:hypothetical protein
LSAPCNLAHPMICVIPNVGLPRNFHVIFIDGFARISMRLQCSTALAPTTPLRASLHHILLSGTCQAFAPPSGSMRALTRTAAVKPRARLVATEAWHQQAGARYGSAPVRGSAGVRVERTAIGSPSIVVIHLRSNLLAPASRWSAVVAPGYLPSHTAPWVLRLTLLRTR